MDIGFGIMPTGRRNWVRSDEGDMPPIVVVVSWIIALGDRRNFRNKIFSHRPTTVSCSRKKSLDL
jgi:hypothetical protein